VQLTRAFRIRPKDVIVLVGGGGKTTLMFRLADELASSDRRVVTTMTTRIFVGQMLRAPSRLVTEDEATLLADLPAALDAHRHVIVAGEVIVEQDKVQGVSAALLDRMAALPAVDAMIVEADGSRRLPFKAPAAHEPVIPASATVVVPLVGLDVLGQPLDAEHVHRPQLVAELTGAALGDPVTPAMLATVLAHPQGGAKNVPLAGRLIPFLNKAEDEATLTAAREIARLLLKEPRIDSVLIGAAQGDDPVREVWGRSGAVVLAAGAAKRFGALKQVLPWHGVPLAAHVADQALRCIDINQVAVTVGAEAEQVCAALAGRNVSVIPVTGWSEGQSKSVKAGLRALALPSPLHTPPSAVLFLLADQPGVSPELLATLIQRHRETLAPIVAPRHNGQRGNPVLFDPATFPEFDQLEGDIGARPIIRAHRDEIAWVDWPTPEILEDIDVVADYESSAQD
jgi:molybdenum cofactor cytidylyltransferase